MSGQRHDLTHQLFVESTPFYQSLYQFLSRRHYAVLFFRRWDWSFGGRHDDEEMKGGREKACRRDAGNPGRSHIRYVFT